MRVHGCCAVALAALACHPSRSSPGTPADEGVAFTGQPLPASAGFPDLPLVPHVRALVRGATATVSFDPVPGAKDYRVYALPKKADLRLAADGSLDGVENGLYRCAGRRAAPPVWVDWDVGPSAVPSWIAVNTLVDNQKVADTTRSLAGANLGYAFADPTPGTVAVYAMGDPDATADNYGYGIREPQTRAKLYVTDKLPLVASGFRDDGVAFYAPSSATSTACGAGLPVAVHALDHRDQDGVNHLYYSDPAELSARGAGTTPFFLCPSQVAGSEAVMRVFYRLASAGGDFGGQGGHDELALGRDRFERARCQGSTFGVCAGASQAAWDVHWSSITGDTDLVVEALDDGCPFQGLLGPAALPPTSVGSGDNNGDTSLHFDPVFTFAQVQAKAPHGEVFINGQADGNPHPHPIARALVRVKPQAREKMDFESNFAGAPETFTEVLHPDGTADCGLTAALVAQTHNPDYCDGSHRLSSETFDALMIDMYDQRYSVGPLFGALGSMYSGGKFRFTPKASTASIADDSFLHVVLEASAFVTGRRYPQIWVTQQDFITSQYLLLRTPPNTVNTNVQPALVIHPIDSAVGRPLIELEMCNERLWQVNNHCPWFLLERGDPPSPGKPGKNNAHPALFDRLQEDRSTRFDWYLSRKKAYVFLDSKPYGCVDLANRKTTSAGGTVIKPATALPAAGPVTVAWGDVDYHFGAESGYFGIYSLFHLNHMIFETQRHFDYVAYKSGVPAPAWDEVASPCSTQLFQGGDAGTQTPEQGD